MARPSESEARKIATVFAARAREESIVREFWVSVENGGVHLWLLIDPIEHDDEELKLYGLVDVLDERFPEADFQLHVLNPRGYTDDLRDSLRGDAQFIPLRTS